MLQSIRWPLVAALLVAGAPASAQVAAPPSGAVPGATQQQYRGLFRGDATTPGLGLVLSGAEGYDTNVLAEQGGGGNSRTSPGVAGEFTEGRGQLTYLTTHGATTVSLSGSSRLRYYPGFDNPTTHNHSAAAAVSFGIGRRFNLALTQSAFYSSFYQVTAFPAAVGSITPAIPGEVVVSAVPTIDSHVSGQAMYGTDSGAELTQTIGGRDSVRYHVMRRQYKTGFAQRDILTQGGGATYNRQMSRYGAVRLGYGYQVADYDRQLAGSTKIHNFDTGYDYSRPLSFSRRTRVGFNSGMQAFDRADRTFYHLLLGANVSHQLGRTWAMDVLYARGAQFIDVVDQPMYADSVSAHADGYLIGRRLHLSIDGRYSNGQLTTTLRQDRLVTYTGSTRLEWGLSESLAAYGTYAFYSYDFGQNIALPEGLQSRVERQSVTGGLRLYLPLITQRGSRGTR